MQEHCCFTMKSIKSATSANDSGYRMFPREIFRLLHLTPDMIRWAVIPDRRDDNTIMVEIALDLDFINEVHGHLENFVVVFGVVHD